MQFVSAGKVGVAAAGTPQPLALGVRTVRFLRFTPAPSATGKVYIGSNGMVKATLAGVGKVFLPPGAAGYYDSYDIGPFDDEEIDTTNFYLDADTNGEGPLVTYAT